MAEYIEKQAFLEHMKGTSRYFAVKFDVESFPEADVAPVRHGRWVLKHRHTGGFHRYTGLDEMGEQHTIILDERAEYDGLYCSECGKQSADNFLNFCPNCGAKMDLEAPPHV